MDDRETRRLYRSDTDKMICGVCGGIGEYFNVDATLIRLLWAVLACSGTGVVAYFIAIFAPAAFAARSFFFMKNEPFYFLEALIYRCTKNGRERSDERN